MIIGHQRVKRRLKMILAWEIGQYEFFSRTSNGRSLTLMLLVTNLANTIDAKKAEKWLKPWHVATHLKVLSESNLMNTNKTKILPSTSVGQSERELVKNKNTAYLSVLFGQSEREWVKNKNTALPISPFLASLSVNWLMTKTLPSHTIGACRIWLRLDGESVSVIMHPTRWLCLPASCLCRELVFYQFSLEDGLRMSERVRSGRSSKSSNHPIIDYDKW